MHYEYAREIELINISKAQRGVYMNTFQFQNVLPPVVYYDWHVKAYSVYLLRQRGIWLDWSDFDN